MKEFSIEEKARRYDEAKLRMSRAFNSNRCSIEFMNEIFPELRESEDERFKEELKEVLDECLNVRPQIVEEKQYMRLIAWLEKQGVHANFRNKIQIGDKVTRNEDGVLVNLSQLKRVAKKDEKQGEQKSYASETMNGKGDFDNGFTRMMEKEQKYAWSEEDEKMLECAIDIIEWYSIVNKSKSKLVSDWLKSLKEKVQPQNRWKESLATADLENSLCDVQDGFSDTSYEYRILGEAIEFIRCAEPKPQWKPSDEQMKGIECAIKTLQHQLNVGDKRLNLLYDDLKKLKEE